MMRMPMDPKLKVVTQLPLRGLWTDSSPVEAVRGRALSSEDVRQLLRDGPVQFVVVEVGLKPRWIELEECYRFWMDEVKLHLIHPGTSVRLEELPECYGYLASEWLGEGITTPIVVLEQCH